MGQWIGDRGDLAACIPEGQRPRSRVHDGGDLIAGVVIDRDGVAVLIGDGRADPFGSIGVGVVVLDLIVGHEVITGDGRAAGGRERIMDARRSGVGRSAFGIGVAAVISPVEGGVSAAIEGEEQIIGEGPFGAEDTGVGALAVVDEGKGDRQSSACGPADQRDCGHLVSGIGVDIGASDGLPGHGAAGCAGLPGTGAGIGIAACVGNGMLEDEFESSKEALVTGHGIDFGGAGSLISERLSGMDADLEGSPKTAGDRRSDADHLGGDERTWIGHVQSSSTSAASQDE